MWYVRWDVKNQIKQKQNHLEFVGVCTMGVCNCSMVCLTLLYVHSSIAIILIEKRELVALLNLFSWCLVMVEWLFLAVPWVVCGL